MVVLGELQSGLRGKNCYGYCGRLLGSSSRFVRLFLFSMPAFFAFRSGPLLGLTGYAWQVRSCFWQG